jgi:carbamate kinase
MGGNSLIDPDLPPTVANQFAVTARAVVPVADFVGAGGKVVITHGNGPQVGFQVLQNELARDEVHELPLDSLVANTQGSIGYMLQRALREELRRRGMQFQVVSMITEVEVDPADHAFEEPTKPIGRFYTRADSEQLTRQRGWQMVEDSGRGYRRVVPSPAPVRVVQTNTIRALLQEGIIPICCGGGGIPVVRSEEGHISGIEGVIDKDRASALLAVRLGAERLVITTGVPGVYVDYMTPNRRLLRHTTVGELMDYLAEGQFPKGSMAPKIKATERFLRHGTGESAIICRPEDLSAAVAGEAGTLIRR